MAAIQLRVLQVIDTLGMGGAETWLMELLRFWSRSGVVHIDFVVTSGVRGLFDDEAKALGSTIHYLPYRRASLLAFVIHFRKILREGRYHAVHDHQDYASGWHFLIGGNAMPPVRITHIHNPSYQILNNYGVTFVRRLAAQLGKALVRRYSTFIAGTSRQVLGEYGFESFEFGKIPKGSIYCGINTARFNLDSRAAQLALREEFKMPSEALVILFAGRIDASPEPSHPQAHKNAGFAIDVAIAAARQRSNVYMLLAGAPSPAVAELQRRIAEAGLTSRILFLGVRSDIELLMAGSNVLLFPSRSEGLGMVAVEAQAAGLPVLASDAVPQEATIVPELVRYKSLADGVEAWAADVLKLAAQPRDPMANYKVATSAFSIEYSAKALESLYSGELS